MLQPCAAGLSWYGLCEHGTLHMNRAISSVQADCVAAPSTGGHRRDTMQRVLQYPHGLHSQPAHEGN